MSTIISGISSIVTAAVSWITSFLGLMTTTVTAGSETTTTLSLIGIFAVIPLVGFGIGLLRRLLNVK